MGPWLGADWLRFEALPLPLFEPQILHLQVGLSHLPGPAVGADRMALCKPHQLRKVAAGPAAYTQWLPITLAETQPLPTRWPQGP